MTRTFMVVGCRPYSLGEAVVRELSLDHDVVRVDSLTETGAWPMDITKREQIVHALEANAPSDILITAGVNLDDSLFSKNMSIQLQVNALGPLMMVEEALDYWKRAGRVPPATGLNICAVSSNSAHIARSTSVGYCASKAALSMGLRCLARREAKGPVRIWGYEPGLIGGTQMTDEVALRFDGPAHRIPSGRSVRRDELAHRIVRDMLTPTNDMNGVMFRMDGGEQ